MLRIILIAFFALVAAVPVAAQSTGLSLAEKMGLGVVMDADAFTRLTDGNTITYNDGTVDVYREYYRKGTNRIVIEWTEQSDPEQLVCDVGTWRQQEDLICFDWLTSGSVCALWVDYNGEYISEIVENGQMKGSIELISTVTTTPLYCEVGMVQLDAGTGEGPAG